MGSICYSEITQLKMAAEQREAEKEKQRQMLQEYMKYQKDHYEKQLQELGDCMVRSTVAASAAGRKNAALKQELAWAKAQLEAMR